MKRAQESKHHSHSQYKSLCSFLKYFEGIRLKIELKNGRQLCGILTESDEYMNLMLEDVLQEQNATATATSTATATAAVSDQTSFIKMYIRGPTIRYIHFPDDADLSAYIRAGQERERMATNKYKRGIRKK